MGSNKNGVSPANVPGAVYFLVGSALGVMAVLHASGLAEVGGEWASPARWAAQLAGSIDAHRLLVAISLLFLAASVWRLAKRCADVEKRVVGNTGSNRCPDKPVSGSQADREEDDNVGETSDSEEGYVQYLKRRLKKERQLTKDALEKLERERSTLSIIMTKNGYLEREKSRVETTARLFQDRVQQNQKYMIEYLERKKARVETEAPQPQKTMQEQQNAMIESLKSMIRMSGLQPEDERDKK